MFRLKAKQYKQRKTNNVRTFIKFYALSVNFMLFFDFDLKSKNFMLFSYFMLSGWSDIAL